MSAVSPVRALVAYYWNVWYFLAAVFGAVASLLLGSWISGAANGTPIAGGYSFFFTGTQPVICLALLFVCAMPGLRRRTMEVCPATCIPHGSRARSEPYSGL